MKVNWILLLTILSFSTHTFSQIEFQPHILTPNPDYVTNSATAIRTFDAENDGDIDFISSSYNVAWYENVGSQNYVQHIITSDDFAATSLETVDWDGDNDIDLIADAALDNRIYWFENDGLGEFRPHLIYSDDGTSFSSWVTYSVHAKDIDGDGDMDALHGGWQDTMIRWHENDGTDTSFTSHTIDNLGERSTVIAGDMDGDNDIDIIATCQYPSVVVWYENDGQQSFTKHIISSADLNPRILQTVDLDKDGDVDVVTANYRGDVTWYENDGQANFSVISIPGSGSCNTLYVVDLDSDNDWDIVTGDPDNNNAISRFGWLENDGQQNFNYHNITNNILWPSSVWADDVDGDGDIDVMFSDLNGNKTAWYESNLNDPTSVEFNKTFPGIFRLSQNYPNPFNPTTNITYALPASGYTEIKVFNTLGQQIRALVNSVKPAGTHHAVWDGRDESGYIVPGGIYFYQLQAGSFVETRKMLYIK